MLNKYQESQPNAIKILDNQIKFNKISHAYLFITNGYSLTEELIKDFIINIISKQKNIDIKIIKHQIEKNSFPDLEVIEPDGLFIKKEQILSLQEKFKTTALENEKKFYIIKDADKLNKSSANTILKFLEEPAVNIIGFLISNNKSAVMETIISRCVNITLSSENYEIYDKKTAIANMLFQNSEAKNNFLNNEKTNDNINAIEKLVNNIEISGLSTLLYINDLFFQKFSEKDDSILALEIMKLLYSDILKYKITGKIEIFTDLEEKNINKISENKDTDIVKKIIVINDSIRKISENANMKLLIDKMIIDLGDVKCKN